MERNQLIGELQSKYPKMLLRTTEEFDGTPEGIWTNGEEPPVNKKGLPLFNYYAENNSYDFGIENNFSQYLDKLGWYCEWYDAGTIFILPN